MGDGGGRLPSAHDSEGDTGVTDDSTCPASRCPIRARVLGGPGLDPCGSRAKAVLTRGDPLSAGPRAGPALIDVRDVIRSTPRASRGHPTAGDNGQVGLRRRRV